MSVPSPVSGDVSVPSLFFTENGLSLKPQYFTSCPYLYLKLHGVFCKYSMYGGVREVLISLLPFLLWLDCRRSYYPYGHVSFPCKFEHYRGKEIYFDVKKKLET